jgi:prepilin-type processing-associated H-X9-DG protein
MRRKKIKNQRTHAFTRIELFVTIAVLVVLAALFLTTLPPSKSKAYQALCQSRLRQTVVAFQIYLAEFHEVFPAPGSKTDYGPQPEDWIWWQPDRNVTNSAIVPYLSHFDPSVFKCPKDHIASSGRDTVDAYPYSFSLTSFTLKDDVNRGMATIVTRARRVYPFKASTIKNPVAKLMLVEEDGATVDDSCWLPSSNLLCNRHDGKCNAAFADGHVESELPKFGDDPANSDPSH